MLAALVSNGGESQKKKQKYVLQSFFLVLLCCFSYHTELLWPEETAHKTVVVGAGVRNSPSLASFPWTEYCWWDSEETPVSSQLSWQSIICLINSTFCTEAWASSQSLGLPSFFTAGFSGDLSCYLSPSGATLIRGFRSWFWTISWDQREFRGRRSPVCWKTETSVDTWKCLSSVLFIFPQENHRDGFPKLYKEGMWSKR